ncbi:MAG TPA: hypothetical protein DIU00_19040 [Phycisphaerales bacterium]|nr:hypothetical protein [Phycisphaerales bacterium]
MAQYSLSFLYNKPYNSARGYIYRNLDIILSVKFKPAALAPPPWYWTKKDKYNQGRPLTYGPKYVYSGAKWEKPEKWSLRLVFGDWRRRV